MCSLSGCGYDRFDDIVVDQPTEIEANIDIKQLNGLVGGGPIEREYVFKGVVTSSDSAGNFYKQLIVEDNTGAVELRLGVYDIHSVFHRWDSIAVGLQRFSTGRYNSLIQVGFGSYGSDNVEAIESWDIIYGLVAQIPGRNNNIGRVVTLNMINKSMAGMTIFIEGYFRNGGVGVYKGRQQFVTKNGNVSVVTSDYASFVQTKLPSGALMLRAIVTFDGNTLGLKMSDLSDAVVL